MAEKPQVKPGDWITIGKGINKIPAVVCAVYSLEPYGDIEVVYLDNRGRAINADVIWDDDGWSLKGLGLSEGYADKHDRLCNFVSKLRAGISR